MGRVYWGEGGGGGEAGEGRDEEGRQKWDGGGNRVDWELEGMYRGRG